MEGTAEKCEHGVYIAKGDTQAIYCSACNPGYARIMAPTSRVMDVVRPERTLDVAEYFEQPLSERLGYAAQMEML